MLRFVLEQNMVYASGGLYPGGLAARFSWADYGKLTKDASRGEQAQGKSYEAWPLPVPEPGLLVESLTEYRIWGQSFHSWQSMGFLSWVPAGHRRPRMVFFRAQRMGTADAAALSLVYGGGRGTDSAGLSAGGYGMTGRKRLATGRGYAESMAAGIGLV